MARRRDRSDAATPTPAADTGADVLRDVLRRLESVDRRLTRVEEVLAHTEMDRLAQAEHGDLIDLRLHSARLAAELSRVTVDLQARIDALAHGRDRTDEPTSVSDMDLENLPPPVTTDATPGWEPLDDD